MLYQMRELDPDVFIREDHRSKPVKDGKPGECRKDRRSPSMP